MSASTGTRQLLFVIGCVVCLLAVASTLPAADPRLPAPTGDDEPAVGEWETINQQDLSPDPAETTDGTDQETDSDADADSESDSDSDGTDTTRAPDPGIEITGALEPGNEVRIEVDDASPFNEHTVEVNGEEVGQTDWGRVDAVVPYAEEMTVVISDETSKTVAVETAATISTRNGAAPDTDFELEVAVGSTPVEDATVSVDGQEQATTDEDGVATVTLPETAGPTEIRAERDPVAGERTVEVAEPEVEFVSPLLFPGSPAPVQVSADDTGVPNATVSIAGSDTATTGDDGRTRIWLPIDDTATVTASVGEETATTTVGNLYLRLAVVVVFGPGFAIGGVITYVRLAARGEGRETGPATSSGLETLLVRLAGLLDGVGRGVTAVAGAGSRFSAALGRSLSLLRAVRLPSLSRAGVSLSLPRFGLGSGAGVGWQPAFAFGSALSSFGSALGSLPSLGSLATSDGSRGSRLESPSLGDLFDRDGDSDGDRPVDDDGPEPPALADEPIGPRGPRAEIRAAWHAVLDPLGLPDRETLTPGQAARRALAAGLPAQRLSTLVAIVRDVEYGRRAPSPERVLEARETASELVERRADAETEMEAEIGPENDENTDDNAEGSR